MITSPAFAGKRYAVLGLARSGLASVDTLLASGAGTLLVVGSLGWSGAYLYGAALMLAGVNIFTLLIDPMMPDQPALGIEILSLLGQCLGGCAVYGICVHAFGLSKTHHNMQTR